MTQVAKNVTFFWQMLIHFTYVARLKCQSRDYFWDSLGMKRQYADPRTDSITTPTNLSKLDSYTPSPMHVSMYITGARKTKMIGSLGRLFFACLG